MPQCSSFHPLNSFCTRSLMHSAWRKHTFHITWRLGNSWADTISLPLSLPGQSCSNEISWLRKGVLLSPPHCSHSPFLLLLWARRCLFFPPPSKMLEGPALFQSQSSLASHLWEAGMAWLLSVQEPFPYPFTWQILIKDLVFCQTMWL